jgi:hypothetical protein
LFEFGDFSHPEIDIPRTAYICPFKQGQFNKILSLYKEPVLRATSWAMKSLNY